MLAALSAPTANCISANLNRPARLNKTVTTSEVSTGSVTSIYKLAQLWHPFSRWSSYFFAPNTTWKENSDWCQHKAKLSTNGKCELTSSHFLAARLQHTRSSVITCTRTFGGTLHIMVHFESLISTKYVKRLTNLLYMYSRML